MRIKEFDYCLLPELVAQHPLSERSASRLLYLDGESGHLSDSRFSDLLEFLRPNDLLVFNDTRVIKARLFGVKQSGGKCEVLVERVLTEREILAQVSASHPPQPGSFLLLEGELKVKVIARRGEFYELRFENDVLAALERSGHVPLPPYITRHAQESDEARYQTVYARTPGAVAAPTAGLHFDQVLLDKLRDAKVSLDFLTLHVGAGTFQPVRVSDLAEHRMHRERFCVPEATVSAIKQAQASKGRVVAVGTTTLRALEAAAQNGEVKAGEDETALFITPGDQFRVVDLLLTNFHLPKSTLLILVSAFGGIENIRGAYQHAIEQRYRFYSYGDAMLIKRA
ncbi:MAG TPA: tRNA preQ1(34) S-adenosylmethionine ribosyltransferase-isomerase QueA [Burkholderiales bacterium]|nr:tRNA preQ1(34) S-adenosylmethionine ribosyltransferase-isomerase QueA [Burkholderiales bacterium]